MNLGENIYRLRSQRNMSQGALADALEVSRQSVSKWENNSATPELDKLIKMSELFSVSLDELVGKEAPVSPAPESTAPEIVIREQTPPHRTIGVILACFGLLVTLLLSILGGFVLGVIAGLPFTIVGCILISSIEGYWFKSAWAVFAIYAPLVYYFILNFMGFGPLIRWGVLLIWLAILAFVSVCLNRKGKLSTDSRKLVTGSIVVALVLLILLGMLNSCLTHRSGLQTATQELDVSSVPMDES